MWAVRLGRPRKRSRHASQTHPESRLYLKRHHHELLQDLVSSLFVHCERSVVWRVNQERWSALMATRTGQTFAVGTAKHEVPSSTHLSGEVTDDRCVQSGGAAHRRLGKEQCRICEREGRVCPLFPTLAALWAQGSYSVRVSEMLQCVESGDGRRRRNRKERMAA